jgi:hypothetical protein
MWGVKYVIMARYRYDWLWTWDGVSAFTDSFFMLVLKVCVYFLTIGYTAYDSENKINLVGRFKSTKYSRCFIWFYLVSITLYLIGIILRYAFLQHDEVSSLSNNFVKLLFWVIVVFYAITVVLCWWFGREWMSRCDWVPNAR